MVSVYSSVVRTLLNGVEQVATVSGGYLTACAAGDDWEVDVGRESASY